MPLTGARPSRFQTIAAKGEARTIHRDIAIEMPVAIECNGIGYAVLMATPTDLLDLATGFALAERLIDAASDIGDAELHQLEAGLLLRLTLAPHCAERVFDRVRHRTSDSSCGLCGVENLEQALRPLPMVATRWDGDDGTVFTALAGLRSRQPLNDSTAAVHAAAACARDGRIRLVREDVGRHNAFDKLIGAMLRDGLEWEGGFALLTSRCSYELVEKAVLSDCPMLVTISAPTALALDRAEAAGLALRVLARDDAILRPL